VKSPGKTVNETGQDVMIFSTKQVDAEHEVERDGGDLSGHW